MPRNKSKSPSQTLAKKHVRPSACTFQRLPVEIRSMIWESCMVEYTWTYAPRGTPEILIALRGDRTLYLEVLEIYYSMRRVIVNHENFKRLGSLGDYAMSKIAHLHLDMCNIILGPGTCHGMTTCCYSDSSPLHQVRKLWTCKEHRLPLKEIEKFTSWKSSYLDRATNLRFISIETNEKLLNMTQRVTERFVVTHNQLAKVVLYIDSGDTKWDGRRKGLLATMKRLIDVEGIHRFHRERTFGESISWTANDSGKFKLVDPKMRALIKAEAKNETAGLSHDCWYQSLVDTMSALHAPPREIRVLIWLGISAFIYYCIDFVHWALVAIYSRISSSPAGEGLPRWR